MPKFILTDTGYLRLGMVEMHRDLLQPGENCLGGGYYEFDFVSNKMILSGKSYDYGRPRWGKLQQLKVPQTYRRLRIVYLVADVPGVEMEVADEVPVQYV